MKDLIERLRKAADDVMSHQWSGDKERMDALQDLCLAELAAADALEAQAARIAELEGAAPLCDKHRPNGGKRAVCLICALQAQSAALSRISYLCGPPNEMECGPYDVHCDESAVVEQVSAKVKRIEELEHRNERLEVAVTAFDGFVGRCPTNAEWRAICGKAAELRAALKEKQP